MPESEHDFGRLYTEYQPRIRRYLARIVGEHDAEEVDDWKNWGKAPATAIKSVGPEQITWR